ncbi:CobW family GTP-binding protein [Reichenbachiella versicolor]|uniref:CobW family GTP-binding protein n=1 Tax=Reichenbachiella versicolor TaxID=1821036 RepID=UPI000D6DFE91|nr:GTP-binding protein [Reichenbachiella versicolor]
MSRIPVHIITGFLGSGKTTFLNHFIKERLPERILVVENECGETNVDGGLVMDGVEEVIELSAGCLCCSLSDGLLDILYEASKNRDQYDRLVIETTGIADPSSIVQVFLEDRQVERFFDLQQVVCLVDASQLKIWLKETEEALRQIALADCILVNKSDLVNPQELKEVESSIDYINPLAKVWKGEHGKFSISQVLEVGTIKPRTVESGAAAALKDHNHNHEINNSHKITTFTLSFQYPLDLNSLTLELNRIANLYRDQVYRVKGFIAIPDYPNRVILQSAHSSFVATDGTPWEDMTNRTGKLVFIGRDIKKEYFEKLFNQYMVRPLESRL